MKTNCILPLDGKSCSYTLEEWGMEVKCYLPLKKEVAQVLLKHQDNEAQGYLFSRKGRYFLTESKKVKWADMKAPFLIREEIVKDLHELKDLVLLSYAEEIKDELFINII